MAEKRVYTIATIGLWHLGEIYSVGLAELGHQVVGISDDQNVADNFSRCVPPLPEPQLGELLAKNLKEGRLSFTTDFGKIASCNVVWFTFDTPVDENDNVDLAPIYGGLASAAPYLQDGVLIVMTSQVPVGTAREIARRLEALRPELKFRYAYSPENLRLGEAMKCFLEPSRIVVGAGDGETFREVEEIFSGLRAEILRMSPASAEMSKHALNAYLATSVSFINDIADVCEKTGADVLDVAKALRSDPRISQKAFLDAGLGFSGGTLGRDLKALAAAAKRAGIVLPVIENVYEKNLKRKDIVVARVKELLGDLRGVKIAILGLTYKAGTRTLRRSRGLEIARELLSAGAKVCLHDPQAEEDEVRETVDAPFFRDPYEAAKGSKAIVLITPWPEFKSLDFQKLAAAAGKGVVFFDTCNLLYNQESRIIEAGFRYCGVGRSIPHET